MKGVGVGDGDRDRAQEGGEGWGGKRCERRSVVTPSVLGNPEVDATLGAHGRAGEGHPTGAL